MGQLETKRRHGLARSNSEFNEVKRKAFHRKWELSYSFLQTRENNEKTSKQLRFIRTLESYFFLELFLIVTVNFKTIPDFANLPEGTVVKESAFCTNHGNFIQLSFSMQCLFIPLSLLDVPPHPLTLSFLLKTFMDFALEAGRSIYQ